MEKIKDKLLDQAREFLNCSKYSPYFSPMEIEALEPFFTNTNGRVFFIHSLPEAVIDVLLSMYSRLKNKRGLRGTFVDSFLPHFLSSDLSETAEKFGGDPEAFLKQYKIKSLVDFLNHSRESNESFRKFLSAMRIDSEYISHLASSPKVKKFLGMWLDKFGHNSIARMAKLSVCMENISILAAKSIEWTRPGSGYIELSTRYVDMSGKDFYPIENELCEFGIPKEKTRGMMEYSFNQYRYFQGENFSGPFPQFLRDKYRDLVPDPAELEAGVMGETCDVLGNFLPSSTLTSVGASVSGEAFPELIRHLLLDNTPENAVLAEMILKESSKIGGDQFSRHVEPSVWKKDSWGYLAPLPFVFKTLGWGLQESGITENLLVPNKITRNILHKSMVKQRQFMFLRNFNEALKYLEAVRRDEFDKLPNHFEGVSAVFSGVMSFRGWRDLHRQQFSTHYRTLVTPNLGFYKYDKPAPQGFMGACLDVWDKNHKFYNFMKSKIVGNIPAELMQYPMALGNLVGFQIGGNLSQMEFCNWQRTKYSVNHEVRRIFVGIEQSLRSSYSWWGKISRADMTGAYVFARTKKGIVLK